MSTTVHDKVFVAAPGRFPGRALLDRFRQRGHRQVLTSAEQALDLRDQAAVRSFFEAELPDCVVLSFGQGDVPDRSLLPLQPVPWLHDNLLAAANVIHAAYLYDVEKLLCLDCSATFLSPVWPSPQARYLQAELLEEGRRACAVLGSAVTELCDSYRAQYGCNFISAVTGGVYGPGVNFGGADRHIVPVLMREVRRARESGQAPVRVTGQGLSRWDLLHLDDLASACLFLLDRVSVAGLLPIAAGQTCTLRELAQLVGIAAGYTGEFEFDGQAWPLAPAPTLDAELLTYAGWRAGVPLAEGVASTYRWYARHHREQLPEG